MDPYKKETYSSGTPKWKDNNGFINEDHEREHTSKIQQTNRGNE